MSARVSWRRPTPMATRCSSLTAGVICIVPHFRKDMPFHAINDFEFISFMSDYHNVPHHPPGRGREGYEVLRRDREGGARQSTTHRPLALARCSTFTSSFRMTCSV